MQPRYTKILLILLLLPLTLFCQNGHGFSFDNYSGIYGVVNNPANSVDSKYRIHVNVLSYNQLGASDIGGLPYFKTETAPNGFNGLEFSQNLTNGNDNGTAFGHSDILLPSVVWNFNERFAVGLLSRSRSFYDYNDTSSNLLSNVNEGFTEERLPFTNSELNNTAQSWTEFGLNLSAILINSNYHFIKLGATGKYYMGRGANEVRGTLNGTYPENDLTLNTGVDPLISLNTFPSSTDETVKPFIASILDFDNLGSGFGGDIGLVYEWRPRETNRVDVRSNSGAVNKYKLKISASVLDIGDITYENGKKGSVTREEISLTNLVIDADNYDPKEGLINTITSETDTNIVNKNSTLGDATFALPMALHLNLDYIILNNNNYYININYIKGLTKVTDDYTSTQMDMITVTPRYETRKFSVYLPINYQETGGITAGLGVRYGPVTIGAAAMSSMFTEGKMRHLYFGVSIPLMKELYR